MFEEASPGCPRRCRQPPLKNGSAGEDEGDVDEFDEAISDSESDFVIEQIEDMSDRFHAGEELKPSDYEYWKWELFVYWRKVERDFEKNIQITLGILAEGFLRK